jgi:transcriptional regulator with XRE-family HTH domain
MSTNLTQFLHVNVTDLLSFKLTCDSIVYVDIYQALGTKVREARRRKNMTQGRLAAGIGVSRASIAQIESGNQKLPLHRVYDLAGVLDVSVLDLLPGVGSVSEFDAETRDRLPSEVQERILSVIKGVDHGSS